MPRNPIGESTKARLKEFSPWTVKTENQAFLACHMELRAFPKIDFYNPSEIEACINEYLKVIHKYSLGPAVESLAVAMHTTSSMIWAIRVGNAYRNKETMAMLEQFRQLCESWLREGMLNAKNPAGFIFALKAKHGWVETNRIQIEAKDNSVGDDETSVKALEQKYLESIVVDTQEGQKELVKPNIPDEIESIAEVVE